MASGITDSDGTHNLPMTEGVNLTSVAGDPWTNQSIWRKGHGLHLSISTDVKRVGTETDREGERDLFSNLAASGALIEVA